MNIWFVTSEAAPLAKTGGLADVCGALPSALQDQGHDVRVMLPWYDWIDGEYKTSLEIQVGEYPVKTALGEATLPGDVPVGLIGSRYYFDRPHLYERSSGPYPDNDQRYCFFSLAVLRLIRTAGYPPDVVHAHDWFTGLVPYHLSLDESGERPATVFTIHNLQHQGRFPGESMRFTGLGREHFQMERLEFHGQINLMKAGILGGDRLTTVSPTYAEEIQTPDYGEGLDSVLNQRSDDLTGIINGIDDKVWNPATDSFLKSEERFDPEDLHGKTVCRDRLLEDLSFTEAELPLVGFVGRLAHQKGVDFLLDLWTEEGPLPGSWVFLGTGDEELEQGLRELEQTYPERVRVRLQFSEEWAHRIEAGCDLFVMPSRFEPCGLNQMYSMQYGTLPLVSDTGGLRDTVIDPRRDQSREATGFRFDGPESESFLDALTYAVKCYRNDPDRWRTMQRNGMTTDWSWSASARRYEDLFTELLEDTNP